MATNTLLQSLNDSANQATIDSSNRRQVETYLASAAIAAGDAVCFDASKTNASDKALYVLKASTNAQTSKCFVGIALEAAAAAGEQKSAEIRPTSSRELVGPIVVDSPSISGGGGGGGDGGGAVSYTHLTLPTNREV